MKPPAAAPRPAAAWSLILLHGPRLPHSAHAALAGPIVLGVCFGVLTRALLLRLDAGPLPSHPHGRINYLFLGLVAAVLGALAPAALLTADYTAGVFLAIGTSQFHSVRQIERDMLMALDSAELVPRGRPYVEGLSMMLETRNYLVMITAMASTAVGLLFGPLPGVAAGLITGIAVTAAARTGVSVGSVATITTADITEDGDAVLVGGTTVLENPAPELRRELAHAIGLRVQPRTPAGRMTLAEPGQRQALLHNLTAELGVHRVGGAPKGPAQPEADPVRRAAADGALLPAESLDPADGTLALLIFPQYRSVDLALRSANGTPLLETVLHHVPKGVQP